VWEHSLRNPKTVIARIQAVLRRSHRTNARRTPA
jgi:DNA-binding response OmpR family regulator